MAKQCEEFSASRRAALQRVSHRFTVDNTSTQVIVIRFGILNFSKECERKPSRRRWFIKFANNIRGMAPSRGNAEP